MENSVFRKSINQSIIDEIAQILEENHIPFKKIDNEKYFDATFVNDPSKVEYQILIDRADFEKAEEIITDHYSKNLEIPEDYYLKEFSDEELKDIIFKKDEWNEFDYEVAKKLLKERGIIISEAEVNQINQERLETLKNNYEKPEDVKNLITFGYIFAIIGCLASFVIGFLLFISYGISLAILKLQKQLPNGERVYYFNENDRRHGKRILIISIVFTIFWTFFFMLKNN